MGWITVSTAMPVASQPGEVEQGVDQLASQLRTVTDHRQESLALRVELGGVVLEQRLRVAVDGAERRPQIVRYGVAEPLELLVRLRQRLFDAAPFREIAGHLRKPDKFTVCVP